MSDRRRAIVTGSDSGIGKATAVELARRGYDVAVTWHTDEEGAKGAASEVEDAGGKAVVKRLDLLERGDIQPLVRDMAEELGGIDVLVNNAGTGGGGPFVEIDLAQWEHVLGVDLTGQFLAGQEAARLMIDQGRGGRIVNVTSVHEQVPKRESAAYCAAKGGLAMLTRVMALELAEHGITVNAVAPGEISTPMTGAHEEDPKELDRKWIPAGRPGHSYEIAHAIAFLASEEASYVTGESIFVDGGLLLMAAVPNAEDK